MVTNMQVAKRLVLWSEPVELPTADTANVVVGGGEDSRGGGEYALLAIELPGLTASAHLDAGQLGSLITVLTGIHDALTDEGLKATVTVDHAALVEYIQAIPSDSNETTAEDASLNEYDARIARWTDRLAAATLSAAQAQGIACVACGHNPLVTPGSGRSMVVVGYGQPGVSSHLFACTDCDEAPGVGDPR